MLLDRVAVNASQYLLVYKKGNTYLVKTPQATKLIWKPPSTYNFKISFSKLELIKSYLKSTMSQKRFSRLVILSIEMEMLEELEYKKIN